MHTPKTLEILATAKIADGLDQADLQHLLAHVTLEAVDKDAVVIAECQSGEAFYVVLRGSLKVLLLKQAGDWATHRITDIHLNTLQPGDCFGEYSLIDSQPASASVIALEPTQLLRMTRADFERIAGVYHRLGQTVYRNLLRILVQRLRNKDRELDLIMNVE